ncbi:hypothetical protein [Georgenia muralis]|uniref:Uncharacterized protein n=1 Tax=Georgenia muralis TaxID=154117 RepID=A0A3N4Z7X2_9MICO|nr:hypothetical protein [Georgenia muralis]RPF28074.1 hypothetical protein EDD32_2583 [Georgenia muralis]
MSVFVLLVVLVLAVLLVVALAALAAAAVVVAGRGAPAAPPVPAWRRAVRRVDTISLVAAATGIVGALVAATVLPTAFVSATATPGLLAALGPVLAGAVYVLTLALGELTWPRPQGQRREAFLVRRPALAPAGHLAARLVLVWLALGAVVVLVAGLIAEPDGRSVGTSTVDSGGQLLSSSAAGPFPGWPYGVPVLVGMVALVLLHLWVRHLITRRPAVAEVAPEEDVRVRALSATRVAQGVQLALAVTIVGLLLVAAGALARVDLTVVAWGAGLLAAGIAVTAVVGTVRPVRP